MKKSRLNAHSKTKFARAMRLCVSLHRKAVRLIWRDQCAFHGTNCKFYGGRGLEVHHIIPQSKSQRLKYVVTNGILLCPHHHDKAEENSERFLKALEKKWSSVYEAYLFNLESLKNHLPLRVFELREAAGELKDICHKLKEKL